jgi:branched-chain amino acid transport system ATP-binding protein
MTALLEIEGLEAGYGASQVLFGMQLSMQSGEVATLLGRNGMGKSTLLRCLCGWLAPSGGRIRFGGEDITGWPALRQVFPNLSVREHLDAFAANRSGAREPWTTARVFELFPRLAERAGHSGQQLSGGEQQMLAIGRALVTNPWLLVLDEATEGLAPLVREEIWRCLSLLRETGQTILVVDKYVQRLIRLADHHTLVERGRVAWAGPSAALAAEPALWQRHLGV